MTLEKLSLGLITAAMESLDLKFAKDEDKIVTSFDEDEDHLPKVVTFISVATGDVLELVSFRFDSDNDRETLLETAWPHAIVASNEWNEEKTFPKLYFSREHHCFAMDTYIDFEEGVAAPQIINALRTHFMAAMKCNRWLAEKKGFGPKGLTFHLETSAH